MPKIVDHDKQKQLVAEAALRLIQQAGLEQATVRNVAVEAGLSAGSLRHYFHSQVELYAFCMNIFVQRVEERVQAFRFEGAILHDLKRLLLHLLPMDEERTVEMEVWYSFNAKARIHPELRPLSEEMQASLYRVSEFVIQSLLDHKLAKPEINSELEAEKLYALVDGLAIHQFMQPGRLSAQRLEEILDQHLNMLCGQSGEL
ncbi:transcriptional regulator, TetR family [Paenibacillus algorifonticola]|uniref:Transcriptional regulator, TetR family n=1 Tax=Paenibacillus algorifonticola TaxID=684063 RepID=A0A1I2BZJ8_9BACL|nr:TetR/AcrR family transcriptional regulator [Paenibacillus algorifonticola]SFE61444.1 transcriptional regulator, TetR family [Paenibacillus algorifonticola]